MIIITLIIMGRLKLAGHIFGMDQQRPAKRILKAKPEGRRRESKACSETGSWSDNDVTALVNRNWRDLDSNRLIWQNLLRKTVVVGGPFCQ
jgi:hypothetical protein